MTPPASTYEFSQDNINKIFSVLVSSDEGLKNHFDNYLHDEYDDESSERLSYLDMAEIGRFLIERIKTKKTLFFKDLFAQVEVIFSKCDSYVDELIVIGLFESIQNNCGHQGIDYYQIFNKWLNPISKQKWDELIDSWEVKDWRENSGNS